MLKRMFSLEVILFGATMGFIHAIMFEGVMLSPEVIRWIKFYIMFFITGSLINTSIYYYDYIFKDKPLYKKIKRQIENGEIIKWKFHSLIILFCLKDSWYGIYQNYTDYKGE